MTQKHLNRIVKKIGRSYLGVFELTFNQLRSACTSLVMAECTKLGKRMDDPVVMDFASTILSSRMRKQYDIHRAARPLDRGIHEKYKGVVDFCGGAYGILKGAVQRERGMAGGGTASSAGAGVKEGADTDLQRRQRAVELKERELQLMERELEAKKREMKILEREQALKAKTSGALQSQVILQCPNHTAPPREPRRLTVFKVLEIKDGEREGMLAVLGAIKAAHARARAIAGASGDDAEKYAKILQHMDCPRFRD
ncbi:unnamed protein product, partial [Hapterophycus canaliculatus]